MNYRVLGSTGLKVSILGFGGIPIKLVNKEDAVAVVNHALDLGVNFFHTSLLGAGYGDSAFKIGSVMKERRDDCYLVVKVGGRTRDEAEVRLQKILDALNTDHVEIVQLPANAAVFSKVMGPGGAYEAFANARDEGVIDFIGITSHDTDFLTDVIATKAFSNLIVPFNYVKNAATEKLIPLAAELSLGVIAMKTMGRGGLQNPVQALRYVLNHGVTTAIVGMNTLSHVEQNVAIANTLQPLTPDEEQQLRKQAEKIIAEGRLQSDGVVLLD